MFSFLNSDMDSVQWNVFVRVRKWDDFGSISTGWDWYWNLCGIMKFLNWLVRMNLINSNFADNQINVLLNQSVAPDIFFFFRFIADDCKLSIELNSMNLNLIYFRTNAIITVSLTFAQAIGLETSLCKWFGLLDVWRMRFRVFDASFWFSAAACFGAERRISSSSTSRAIICIFEYVSSFDLATANGEPINFG